MQRCAAVVRGTTPRLDLVGTDNEQEAAVGSCGREKRDDAWRLN